MLSVQRSDTEKLVAWKQPSTYIKVPFIPFVLKKPVLCVKTKSAKGVVGLHRNLEKDLGYDPKIL